MLRLLSIELDKIKRNRAAKVITIVYCSLILGISLFASYEFNFAGINFRIADQGIFNFPFIWHFNGFMASWLKIFLAIVIVSIVANEYSYNTLKQNLIDGLSKKEFILSKFLAVLLFSVISSVFLFVVSLTLGLVFSDFTEISIVFTDLQYLLGYFIKLTTNLLPLNAMSDLISEPFTRLGAVQTLANQVGESFEKSYDVPWHSMLICLVWTTVFVYGSYLILKRRDL